MFVSNEAVFSGFISVDKTNEQVKNLHKILGVNHLTDDTFIIRFERKNIDFRAGQHIQVRIPGRQQFRLYSVYSGINEPYFEILVKEVKDGYFTPLLKLKRKDEYLEIKGPKGNYCLNTKDIINKQFLFIATGTGIAPFHSFVLSHPGLDYQLLHGVKYLSEAYGKDDYDVNKLKICTSNDVNGNFKGRVTDYVKEHLKAENMLVYLCGSSNMINDMTDLLKSKGYTNDQIFIESYF
jgi:ferredoxin--NADP+ reductase/benzoate/toluate 1,2-dioxygenase reductase subunit